MVIERVLVNRFHHKLYPKKTELERYSRRDMYILKTEYITFTTYDEVFE